MWASLIADEKVFGALIALFGVLLVALMNLYWNFRSAKAARKQPFLEAQLSACLQTCRATGKIVGTDDAEVKKAGEAEFWALYWGELAVVEDRDVEAAMVEFGQLLKAPPRADGNIVFRNMEIQQCALNLTRAVRALILKSWHVQMPELHERRALMLSRPGTEGKQQTHINWAFARNPD